MQTTPPYRGWSCALIIHFYSIEGKLPLQECGELLYPIEGRASCFIAWWLFRYPTGIRSSTRACSTGVNSGRSSPTLDEGNSNILKPLDHNDLVFVIGGYNTLYTKSGESAIHSHPIKGGDFLRHL
jgi:hypothetical protein